MLLTGGACLKSRLRDRVKARHGRCCRGAIPGVARQKLPNANRSPEWTRDPLRDAEAREIEFGSACGRCAANDNVDDYLRLRLARSF
jgi:hypothetical protein